MDCDADEHYFDGTVVTRKFMILDTNILLSKLDLLKKFVPIAASADLVVIIPMKVIDELDGLKVPFSPTRIFFDSQCRKLL
jgi:hypothetical protein